MLLAALVSLLPSLDPRSGSWQSPDALVPREWLVLAPVDRRGRRPFRPDAVFARHLLDPRGSPPPAAGESLRGEIDDRDATWEARTAGEDGTLDAQRAAWAYAALELDAPQVRLLEARGAGTVFVNGVPVAGDLYAYGTPGVPVLLRQGRNDLYAGGLRGLALRLRAPERGIDLAAADLTLPDLVRGERPSGALGVVIVCAEVAPSGPLTLEAEGPGFEIAPLALATGVAPLSLRKVALALGGPAVSETEAQREVVLVLRGGDGVELARRAVRLEVREPGTLRQATYVSEVDGAAIDYALLPPSGDPRSGTLGLVLSLHGAGVTARGQAACYAPKTEFWIAAPSNRRPYGFDWQDWGRRDAYDVLEIALARSNAAPDRVYVTGHSMGGHGAWHVAANDPDRFAACAPSAAWESFDSYGGRPDGARAALWRAADTGSRTLDMIGNLRSLPIYVLHGTADDNVPVSEALRMSEALAGAGATFDLHLEGGGGHWWGNECVDWKPIFELFERGRRPPDEEVLDIDWSSADPRVDSRHHWLRVEQPLRYGEPVRVRARWKGDDRRFEIETTNARFLAVSLAATGIELDGQSFGSETEELRKPPYVFVRGETEWSRSSELSPPAREKSSTSGGPFKRAFDRRFVLVVGTRGDEVESAELLARARHDGEQWWYRGNGQAELVTDEAFLALESGGRNVILYGNRDTNAAWDAVLESDCPIQAWRGRLLVGTTEHQGDALGAVFVRPRRNESESLVGVLADTGARGTRVGLVLTPFMSGVGYPDWAVFDERVLTEGDGGVLDAGWFEHDWSLR